MNRFTIPQRVNIVKAFYINGESAAATYRALRHEYGSHNRPSERTISSTVKKFKETGTVTDVIRPVHHRNARSSGNIAAVKESVDEDPNLSIPKRAQKLGLSYGTVWRILHTDLNLPPQNTGRGGRPKKITSENDEEHSVDADGDALDEIKNENEDYEESQSTTGAVKIDIECPELVEQRPPKHIAKKRADNSSEKEDDVPKKRGRPPAGASANPNPPLSGKSRGRPKTFILTVEAEGEDVKDDVSQNSESNDGLEALKGFDEEDFFSLKKPFS